MEQLPRFKPGQDVPVFAEAAIKAGRFVSIVGPKTAQGDYPAEHAVAGTAKPFGVAERDSGPTTDPEHAWTRRVNVTRPHAIARVTAGEEIDELDEVAVGADGKAAKAAGATAATVKTGLVGENNAIQWTARQGGEDGNDLSVTIVDPAGNNVALSVDVDGDEIVVTGATDGSSNLTSTAADVIAAIKEHDTASQLVTVANSGSSNGTGVVKAVAKTNLAGGEDEAATAAVGRALTAGEADDVIEVDLY